METKKTFIDRLLPYVSSKQIKDIKLAYMLSKFGHRHQLRKELVNGEPERYFEHPKRVAIHIMDIAKIYAPYIIISALCHDVYEDVEDLDNEMIQHVFGEDISVIIKGLSKDPKEGYIDRISKSRWEVKLIKLADRYDNVSSLLVEGVEKEFVDKQVKETVEKYYPIFNNLLVCAPAEYTQNILALRDKLFEQVTIIKTKQEINK